MQPSPYIAFYDGNCRLCTGSKRAIERHDHLVPVRWINLNDDEQMRHFPMIDRQAAQGQMFVLSPDQGLTGGYDAVVTLLANTTTYRPLAPLLGWRPIHAIGRKVYRWTAANRYRLFGSVACDDACALPPR